jgi:hypothetical protein
MDPVHTGSGAVSQSGSTTLSTTINIPTDSTKFIIFTMDQTNGGIISATLGGVSLNLVAQHNRINGYKTFYLDTPPTGNQTLVLTRSGSSYAILGRWWTGKNIKTGTPMFTHNSDYPFSENVSTLTTTVTTPSNNCISIMAGINDNAQTVSSSTSGNTTRYTGTGGFILIETPVLATAGSQTIQYSGGSAHFYGTMVTLEKAESVVTNYNASFLNLMRRI